MTRFQLVVIDESHYILTTEEILKQEQVQQANAAFAWWKENGGALIIGDCLTRDRHAVDIDLDLGDVSVADTPRFAPGRVAVTTRDRGFLRAKPKPEEERS